MPPLRRLRLALFALTALCDCVLAAEPAVTQIMLVGTYHFSNPGKDLNNVKAVDILAADRQREIGNVVEGQARFAPTMVAVEWPAAVVTERYAKFREGQLPESRNEVVQLGFRLARERRLASVCCRNACASRPACNSWTHGAICRAPDACERR
jgi:hypothetical protein